MDRLPSIDVYNSAIDRVTERSIDRCLQSGLVVAEDEVRQHLEGFRANVRPHIRHSRVQEHVHEFAASHPQMQPDFQDNATGTETHLIVDCAGLVFTTSYESREPTVRMKPGEFRRQNAEDHQLPLPDELGDWVRSKIERELKIYGLLVYGVAEGFPTRLSFVQMIFSEPVNGRIVDRVNIGDRNSDLLGGVVSTVQPEEIAADPDIQLRPPAKQMENNQ